MKGLIMRLFFRFFVGSFTTKVRPTIKFSNFAGLKKEFGPDQKDGGKQPWPVEKLTSVVVVSPK
jgi:hypothetical protein